MRFTALSILSFRLCLVSPLRLSNTEPVSFCSAMQDSIPARDTLQVNFQQYIRQAYQRQNEMFHKNKRKDAQ